jgi:hypothetical protein
LCILLFCRFCSTLWSFSVWLSINFQPCCWETFCFTGIFLCFWIFCARSI